MRLTERILADYHFGRHLSASLDMKLLVEKLNQRISNNALDSVLLYKGMQSASALEIISKKLEKAYGQALHTIDGYLVKCFIEDGMFNVLLRFVASSQHSRLSSERQARELIDKVRNVVQKRAEQIVKESRKKSTAVKPRSFTASTKWVNGILNIAETIDVFATDEIVTPEVFEALIAPDDYLVSSIRISMYRGMIAGGAPKEKALEAAKGVARSLFDEDCEMMAASGLIEEKDGYVVGGKVGGTSFKFAETNEGGRFGFKGEKKDWETVTGKKAKDLQIDEIVKVLGDGIIEVIDNSGHLRGQNKIKIGISAPGQTEVDGGWGRIASYGSATPNIPLHNTPLAEKLENILKAKYPGKEIAVYLINDSFSRLKGELSKNGTIGSHGWVSGSIAISGTGVNVSMAENGKVVTDNAALSELGNTILAPRAFDPLRDGFINRSYDWKGQYPPDTTLAEDGLQRAEVLTNGAAVFELAKIFGFKGKTPEEMNMEIKDAAASGDEKAFKLIELYGLIVGKYFTSIMLQNSGYNRPWAGHTVLVSGNFENWAKGVPVPENRLKSIRKSQRQQVIAASNASARQAL